MREQPSQPTTHHIAAYFDPNNRSIIKAWARIGAEAAQWHVENSGLQFL